MKRLLFIPLDDRPATRETVLDLLPLVGADWATPPKDLLGHRRRPADLDALWRWVDGEAASADALIASSEVLVYGGLVASRLSVDPMEVLWRRLDRVIGLAQRVPMCLSAVNPRIPAGGAEEDPAYWEPHGDALRAYSQHLDAGEQTGDELKLRQAMRALETVPAPVIDDLLRRRRRQLLINLELIAVASAGGLRALLIGQDDARPYGLTRADLAALRRFRDRMACARVHLSAGADELGARLLARLANDTASGPPRVAVRYTFPEARRSVPRYEPAPLEETVAAHLEAAGCTVSDEGPEILLWVHNFTGVQQRESVDQRGAPPAPTRTVVTALAEAAARGMICGCADVRFANGADDALVRALLAREDLAGLAGYAGWNTCSNSLGTVVAQVVLAYHARARLSPARYRQIRRRMLTRRLLDDWGYQTIVRPYLAREVVPALETDPSRLGPAAPTVKEAALRRFREQVVPAVERALGHPALAGLNFPWDRLFEVDVVLPDYEQRL
ncbi:MAG: DUF4127 family protein [Armatimonadetes bacterium]|nr:DUF4127 family protein [Armatimonadota bacterium]